MACRSLVDSRAACLPAYLAAVGFLGTYGAAEDVERLARLAAEPALGSWEITQLRQVLREASDLVADEENQKRFALEDNIETAKQVAGFLLRIAGKAVSAHAAHNVHHTPVKIELRLAGGATDGLGKYLLDGKGTDFYQQQQRLRELMARLPGLIEQRKGQIAETAPRLVQAAEEAMARLRSRLGPAAS